ncbi:hypothetical protein HAX54_050834 [Datura stramonium]|uniref:Uncharacterized protein n=1 Tax=Datura stramonium TaxID=4076 RepID=A0ABS8SXL5_DATST|nr:hypothetical protein [Datura stramonium]
MGKVSTTLNQRLKGTLPRDTILNSRNEGHCMVITTRREIILNEEPNTNRGVAAEKKSLDLKDKSLSRLGRRPWRCKYKFDVARNIEEDGFTRTQTDINVATYGDPIKKIPIGIQDTGHCEVETDPHVEVYNVQQELRMGVCDV